MGFLEKLKNTFFEEEYVEVEEKEEKPIARKVESKPKKEVVEKAYAEDLPKQDEEIINEDRKPVINYSDNELLKKDNNIQYFEDEDFVEKTESPKKVEKPVKTKIYGEDIDKVYNFDNYSNVEENHKPYSNSNGKTGFKPTPVISPIYGVLDKNYRKEEVIDKKDKPSSYVSRKNNDFDFVRNKAFGNLEDDIMEKEEKPLYQEDNNDSDNDLEDNLLVDMTEADTLPAVDKVTIADAEEYFEDLGLEYNIDYKDSHYEKATGRRTRRRSDKEEKVEEQNDTNNEKIDDNNEADDNLFDLVDSMYDEKE